VTYTNNWPHEPLIDNRPTGQVVVWSVVSFVLLLAGIGAMAWYFAAKRGVPVEEHEPPAEDPLLALHPTPSMRATLKYFWVVAALLVVQIGLGAIAAHYAVEGSGFYGIPLAKWLPYSVARTWHNQLGIFWDRYRVAGHRPVHGPGGLRPRTALPARRRQLPVCLPAHHCGGLAGRAVAGRAAKTRANRQFLARPPGL